MLKDVWFYAKPAAWSLLDPETDGIDEYNFNTTITDFVDSYPGGYEVYNVLCTAEDRAAIKTALGADCLYSFAWIQGTGVDDIDAALTIPAEVLAVMPDHVTYDEDGNETSRTPATYANPNWRHVFVDQKQRIFAGEFNEDFSSDYR